MGMAFRVNSSGVVIDLRYGTKLVVNSLQECCREMPKAEVMQATTRATFLPDNYGGFGEECRLASNRTLRPGLVHSPLSTSKISSHKKRIR
jgi:hypothetical protein